MQSQSTRRKYLSIMGAIGTTLLAGCGGSDYIPNGEETIENTEEQTNGDVSGPSPSNTNWDLKFEENEIELSHEGGGEATTNEYIISDANGNKANLNSYGLEEMTAGDSISIDGTNGVDVSSATLKLVWIGPSGDHSQTIMTFSR